MADKTRAERNPDGYAYRYHSQLGGTVLRFNHGEDVNGGRPFEVVPYWFSPPDPPRGDGWEALRELRSELAKMRQKSVEEYDGSVYQLDCIDVMLRRLLAAAPNNESRVPRSAATEQARTSELDGAGCESQAIHQCSVGTGGAPASNAQGAPVISAAPKEPEPAICEFCTNPMPDTDGHGLGECVPVCDRCDGSGVDPADVKRIKPSESPAEPAQDMRGLFNKFTVTRHDGADKPGGKHDGCDYFVLDLTHDKHAKAAILAYADACEKDRPQLAKDLRDRMGWAQPTAEPVQADLRAKLAAYEAHQSYRPLIPGNLIDRIDEHGQEWTRTERVRAAVAELVQPQTVEEITRLREKLAVAEERIAEMRGIAKGFFQWTVHGESTKEMANRMRRVLKRIAEMGRGGA